jgi:hypothetical protein
MIKYHVKIKLKYKTKYSMQSTTNNWEYEFGPPVDSL